MMMFVMIHEPEHTYMDVNSSTTTAKTRTIMGATSIA